LDNYTKYFWRVDEVGPFGIAKGDSLSFRTSASFGYGLEADPFLIQNLTDLLVFSIDPNVASFHFELTDDLNMNELQEGTYEPFSLQGVLDGNDHSISNFQYSGNDNEVGFFSSISGTVKNLILINPYVDGGSGEKIGALAGSVSRYAKIENCHVDNAVVSGSNYIGGLVGYAGIVSMYDTWAIIMSNCSSSGIVSGNDYVGGIAGIGRATNTSSSCAVSGTNYIGGLIGYSVYNVTHCRAEGTVSGNDYIGGLIGRSYSENFPYVSVENSYAIGNVTGQTRVGGLVGYQPERISNCYARGDVDGVADVGGLCGICPSLMVNCYSTGIVTGTTNVGGLTGTGSSAAFFNCFWDIQTSGQTGSGAGRGKTTELMKIKITYAGFGCDEAWTIDHGNDYPYLLWEDKPGQLITKPTYGGGSGEPNDPYLIYTAEQMSIIGLVLCDYDKHFQLMNDIDMFYYDEIDGRPNYNIPGIAYMESGSGREQPFSGVFDGSQYTISNLYLDNSGEQHVGCFGFVDGEIGSTGEGLAEVKNIRLVNPYIVDDSWASGGIGPLVGCLRYGKVSNCSVVGGTINATTNPQSNQRAYVGGLVGINSYHGIITRSYASCSVLGSGQWCYVGGLAGENWRTAKIVDCYSNSSVEGFYDKTGGLVGENYEATIRNCYSTGAVTTEHGNNGGLVDRNDDGIIEASFWDIQSSGCTSSAGGTGLTTEEMQNPTIFLNVGWDFIDEGDNGIEDIWRLCNHGVEYPQFQWQYAKGDIVCPDGVDYSDLVKLCDQWLYELLPEEIDFHKDNIIDFLDWAVFAAAWQSQSFSSNWNPICDIWPEGGDDKVNEGDLALFLEFWLKGGYHYLQANIAPESAKDYIVNMLDFALLAESWMEP
jgi:hypothetical protein